MQVPPLPASFEYPPNYVNTSLEEVKSFLRQQASYIFLSGRWQRWKLRTWAKHVRPCMIRKGGVAADIARLPAMTGRHAKRPRVTEA